ncbi:MAG TPA: MerR family transcriptional regulator [Acidisarcina sp.]|nr:MerR family transcriptional regulator [Acidisarcina sp.]
MTISELARSCSLSRTTVLYYESIGLLRVASRSPGNYRQYTDADLDRLKQICVYRTAGLSLASIRSLLQQKETNAAAILKRRLLELDEEIEHLRQNQKAILQLLRAEEFASRTEMINKEKWVSIMKAAGFTEQDMQRWHHEFEKNAPEEHQEFLQFLHIPAREIASIRAASR